MSLTAPAFTPDRWKPRRDQARTLATWLREHDLPGRRSQAAIERLWRERSAGHQSEPIPSLEARLHARLTTRYAGEVQRRGGEVAIEGKRASDNVPLGLTDREQGMVLLHAEGYRYYSSRFGARWSTISYLCGHDVSGDWALRVPGTITSVRVALTWSIPSEVEAARIGRRRHLRQGDVWCLETTPDRDGSGELPPHHVWDAERRRLVHEAARGQRHRSLRIQWPVRFVPQRALPMGRLPTGGRGTRFAGGD